MNSPQETLVLVSCLFGLVFFIMAGITSGILGWVFLLLGLICYGIAVYDYSWHPNQNQ